MAEVKGKFITLAVDLIKTKPEARALAIEAVKRMSGCDPYDLDQEGFYDTSVLESVFSSIEKTHPGVVGWATIKVIGQLVYPTIKTTVGLPGHLQSPAELIRFDAEGFLANHRGRDIVPRNFIRVQDHDILVEAPSPGYNCALIEGVYEGILQLTGVKDGKVVQVKCVKRGDSTCIYHITWSGVHTGPSTFDWTSRSFT